MLRGMKKLQPEGSLLWIKEEGRSFADTPSKRRRLFPPRWKRTTCMSRGLKRPQSSRCRLSACCCHTDVSARGTPSCEPPVGRAQRRVPGGAAPDADLQAREQTDGCALLPSFETKT